MDHLVNVLLAIDKAHPLWQANAMSLSEPLQQGHTLLCIRLCPLHQRPDIALYLTVSSSIRDQTLLWIWQLDQRPDIAMYLTVSPPSETRHCYISDCVPSIRHQTLLYTWLYPLHQRPDITIYLTVPPSIRDQTLLYIWLCPPSNVTPSTTTICYITLDYLTISHPTDRMCSHTQDYLVDAPLPSDYYLSTNNVFDLTLDYLIDVLSTIRMCHLTLGYLTDAPYVNSLCHLTLDCLTDAPIPTAYITSS